MHEEEEDEVANWLRNKYCLKGEERVSISMAVCGYNLYWDSKEKRKGQKFADIELIEMTLISSKAIIYFKIFNTRSLSLPLLSFTRTGASASKSCL